MHLGTSTTTLPTRRRALRRARARARLQWHLHRTGVQPLGFLALARIRRTLLAHHSQDRSFIARLSAEMASTKQPWRCRICYKMAKPSMPRCAWCGKTWQEVMDYTFQPGYAQHQQPHVGSAGWSQAGQGNAQGRKPTPRRKSRRGKRDGGSHPQSGQQQGAQGAATHYYPPGNWAPNPGNGPYVHPQMHPPPVAPQQNFAPPPPPPLPQGPVPAPDQFWIQQMNQMPVLNAAPTAAMSSTPSAAELHLQNILGALRHSEETWTPEVQQAVQKVDQTNLQLNLGQVHASVHEIGRAKTEVAEAEAARLRLITSWRTFLQYSVSRWKEYASLFQSQETAIQNQITAAKAQLVQAQRQFGRTSEVVRDGSIQISDEEDGTDNSELKQVKDEEMKSEAAHKIAAGLSQVVDSLQQLSDQAEAEERKAKRLRSSGDTPPGEAPAPSSTPAQLPSMQPFGTPGVK